MLDSVIPSSASPRDLLHPSDLDARVAALPAVGTGRLHDLLDVEASQERRLDAEHVGNLTHRVEGRVLVIERQTRHLRLLRLPTRTRSSACASIAVGGRSRALICTRRGLAFSATGMRSVSTPSM